MSKSDQWIIVFVAILIAIHLSVLAISILYHKISWIPLLNSLAALLVIVYWIQKQFMISHFILYPSEFGFISFEVLVLGFSAYSLLNNQSLNWLTILQKTIFGIHLTVLVLFLVFMLTFKIDRLFWKVWKVRCIIVFSDKSTFENKTID